MGQSFFPRGLVFSRVPGAKRNTPNLQAIRAPVAMFWRRWGMPQTAPFRNNPRSTYLFRFPESIYRRNLNLPFAGPKMSLLTFPPT